MSRLDVWIDDESLGGSSLVGHLSKSASRTGDTISFEHDSRWLANAGPVSAFALDNGIYPGAGQQFAKLGPSELSGVFQDASPDRWANA